MVSKTSLYRQEYRPASLVKNIPTYYESLTYRHHRRELEYAHTPISWDADLDDKSESPQEDAIPISELKIEEEEEENKVVDKKEEIKNKETNDEEKILREEDDKKEKINVNNCEEEEKIAVSNAEQKRPVSAVKKSDVLVEKQTSETRELTKLAKEKLKKYSSMENKNTSKLKPSQSKNKVTEDFLRPKHADEKIFEKRPKRPDRSGQIPSRPKTACSSSLPRESVPRLSLGSPRPLSAASCDKPPFVLYGSGDTELETGHKRTYNVHCSTDIYPTAVKARQQHYLRAKKLEDLRKKILLQKKKHKNAFANKISKETTGWCSEYQNQYPTYDNEEYARRLRALEFARARKVKCDL
ncbi:RNA polymerase-associated protein LEO1-like [Saccostrea echinata]|uniref:RNA polymerase-associated protein LEO1-like n=1 Tax=Saccostrea echinata TaxID=191078 RepID=UPI002A7F0A2A|nr:RNA polymerase-associated protein LEO1-like [Saccostrea echinata]